MARRRSLRDMREEHEAAEARGLVPKSESKAKSASEPARGRPTSRPGLKVVWNVCDQGGRTVATFAFNEQEQAQAHADMLKAKGKGKFFLRSEKVRMD